MLNKRSNVWFDKTRDTLLNPIVKDGNERLPDFSKRSLCGRTMMVEKLNMIPFEFVVRGYRFGSPFSPPRIEVGTSGTMSR